MRSGRFTVDNLVEAPDRGARREVLDGRLVLAPPRSRRHERVVGNLASAFWQVLPRGAQVRGGVVVRLPDGDGPVPDLVVSPTVSRPDVPMIAAVDVYTAVEVVSADGRFIDRVWKREAYARSGIGCYWRVELDAWPGYRGPLPVVVVRLREGAGWREILAPAGSLHALPVACARGAGGPGGTVPVRLDPASLSVRHATTR